MCSCLRYWKFQVHCLVQSGTYVHTMVNMLPIAPDRPRYQWTVMMLIIMAHGLTAFWIEGVKRNCLVCKHVPRSGWLCITSRPGYKGDVLFMHHFWVWQPNLKFPVQTNWMGGRAWQGHAAINNFLFVCVQELYWEFDGDCYCASWILPHLASEQHALRIQWNLSKTDTIGNQHFVRYSEVSLTQGLPVYFR